jgi:sodium/bile acid cotransporter 7
VPIAVAQLARRSSVVAAWATRHKHLLANIAQLGILSIVLVGAVGSGERIRQMENGASLAASSVVVMLLVVVALHLVLLFVAFYFANWVGMSRPDAIAVGIAGSQKTIMVGLYVALAFGPLAILPMVAYHAAQLLIDTLVADWWRRAPQGV